MKYQIIFTGGKSLMIDQSKKDEIEKLLRDKSEKIIKVGGNLFKTNTIKGIFEIEEIDHSLSQQEWLEKNKEWNDDCLRLSQLPIEEKVEKEIKIRVTACGRVVIPGEILEAIRQKIRNFFEINPKMPRCHASIWIDDIKPYIQSNLYYSRFYDAVGRNDIEIARWAKYQGVKINYA